MRRSMKRGTRRDPNPSNDERQRDDWAAAEQRIDADDMQQEDIKNCVQLPGETFSRQFVVADYLANVFLFGTMIFSTF